ncbi:MAG: hypothetical protein LUD69_07895 [Oscillospiraceae bacterium]|nr:hypothetical protein [Oscillospiraceae bacterium]
MSEMNDIVKLAIDSHRGSVQKYSVADSQNVLREALIEANNGKTALDYKDIRDGKCVGLFSLIEEILSTTVYDGLTGTEFWNELVDSRNLALGDQNVFLVENRNMFAVSEAAEGTQGIRRQRLSGVTEVAIPTTWKVIRIYEEMNRVLAGRVDFNAMINKASESFTQRLLYDIFALWSNVAAADLGGEVYFPTAGAYDEDALLDLIAHVEAAAGGKTATIIGTKRALKYLKESVDAESAKDEIHSMGYYGKFYGTPIMCIPQRHKYNTTEFLLPDDVITVIASDEKPLKVVYEGDSLMLQKDPLTNADFTYEAMLGQRWGMGLVTSGYNSGIGRYEITA